MKKVEQNYLTVIKNNLNVAKQVNSLLHISYTTEHYALFKK